MRNKALSKDIQVGLTPNAVLHDLLAGNERYTSNNITASDVPSLVEQTTNGQFPKAVILSCIDSHRYIILRVYFLNVTLRVATILLVLGFLTFSLNYVANGTRN